LYEVIPVGVKDSFIKSVDQLKYQLDEKKVAVNSEEIMTIKLRYKEPGGEISKLIQQSVLDSKYDIVNTSDNFRFSAAVAEFGLLLRGSEYKQESSFGQVVSLARGARGKDEYGYRSEFFRLVESAKSFAKN
jgi:Ca-activated chloride channel family protein